MGPHFGLKRYFCKKNTKLLAILLQSEFIKIQIQIPLPEHLQPRDRWKPGTRGQFAPSLPVRCVFSVAIVPAVTSSFIGVPNHCP